MSAVKISDVLMAENGEIRKRPYPVKIVRQQANDWWLAAFLIGLFLGHAMTLIALLTKPGM
jgi:hypothetical protein